MDLNDAVAIVKKGYPRPFAWPSMERWYEANDMVMVALRKHPGLMDSLLKLECPVATVEAPHV